MLLVIVTDGQMKEGCHSYFGDVGFLATMRKLDIPGAKVFLFQDSQENLVLVEKTRKKNAYDVLLW